MSAASVFLTTSLSKVCGTPDTDEKDEKEKAEAGITADRSCTDICCFPIFFVFWIGMMILLYVAVTQGEPERLLFATDYNGDTCGGAGENNANSEAGKDADGNAKGANAMAPYGKFVYYPRLAEDALLAIEEGDPTKIEMYGVCVAECPAAGTISCTYEKDFAVKTANTITKDGKSVLDKQGAFKMQRQLAFMRDGCWDVFVDTKNVFYRCLPWPVVNSTKTYECTTVDVNGKAQTATIANPSKCLGELVSTEVKIKKETNGGGQLLDALVALSGSIQQHVGDVMNSYATITFCGLVVSAILGFLFIQLMRLVAGIIVWTIILALWVLFLASTLVCFYKAGIITNEGMQKALEMAANRTGKDIDSIDINASLRLDQVSPADEANTIKMFEFASYILAVITFLYIFVVIAVRKRIALCIAIIKFAGKMIGRMKMILLYPFVTLFWVTFIMLYALSIGGLIASTASSLNMADLNAAKASINSGASPADIKAEIAAQMASQNTNTSGNATEPKAMTMAEVSENKLTRYMLMYHFFGYLWTNQLVQSMGMIIMAISVGSGYFVTDSADTPKWAVINATKKTWRYHAGSAIFGALIIAIVQFIRAIMMYVTKQVEAQAGGADKLPMHMKVIMAVANCCMWCVEKIVKFLTKNAYIIVGIEGKYFCTAAFRSFKLLFANAVRFAVMVTVSFFMLLLARIAVALWSAMVCYIVLTNADRYIADGEFEILNTAAPCAIVFVVAFIVSTAFFEAYGMTIDTLLLCFCVDEKRQKENAGAFNYASVHKLDEFISGAADGEEVEDGDDKKEQAAP